MVKQTVDIVVYRGKAYLPALGQFPSGIYTAIEPVQVAQLTMDDLASAARKILERGISPLPEVTAEEWRRRSDPLLKATKVRNWKELGRNGLSYGITWTDQHICVDMSYRDKQGRWQNDPAKVRTFPLDTPLEDVLAVILEDIRARPELQSVEKA